MAEQQAKKAPVYTTSAGCPVTDVYAAQRIGRNGPLLLQDHHLIDLLAHFDRERIPERVVHAKGAGAYGEFEVTDDISDLTCAKFLSEVGKKTKLFTRFSTVGGEKGTPDAARDPRGFSIKMYTEEGNLDWVFNNTPIFFIRNPTKFPLFIHTQKRNPQTNLKDATAFWDYFVQNQECVHQVMILFSNRGTPKTFRNMHGYSGHAFKFVKADGSFNYVQIHLKTDQGIENLTNDDAIDMQGKNPDNATQDLFEHIEQGKFPSWTAYVQVMSPEEAEKQDFNIFDLTKVWPQKQFPLRKFGKLTLNKNPKNYFAEVEQAAFSPAHTVPGWEPTADPVLQSRLFSYSDTHRHRLGVNYQQIPVNCPYSRNNPFQRDGFMQVDGNYGAEPNYPSSFEPVKMSPNLTARELAHEEWVGKVTNYNWAYSEADGDYVQASNLWKVFKKSNQDEDLIYNISVHVKNADEAVQTKVLDMFSKVDKEIADRLKSALGKSEVQHRL